MPHGNRDGAFHLECGLPAQGYFMFIIAVVFAKPITNLTVVATHNIFNGVCFMTGKAGVFCRIK